MPLLEALASFGQGEDEESVGQRLLVLLDRGCADRLHLPCAAIAQRRLDSVSNDLLAAIRLGLNNGRLEGLNSRIRLISYRSFGFHSASPLIALIYLCCTGIVIPLPR